MISNRKRQWVQRQTRSPRAQTKRESSPTMTDIDSWYPPYHKRWTCELVDGKIGDIGECRAETLSEVVSARDMTSVTLHGRRYAATGFLITQNMRGVTGFVLW